MAKPPHFDKDLLQCEFIGIFHSDISS